jgi:pimeloyl-ACP methyl ester carboxylesterase
MSEAACFEHKLSAITASTLILSGAEDKVVPPANVDLLAQKISRAETAVIDQAGHFFPFEQPETAITIVTNFLQNTK